MTTPVASSSHPVQIPALDSVHAGDAPKKGGKDKKKAAAATASGHPLELDPKPEFFDHRIKMFEQLKTEYDEWVKAQPREEIVVTMPDGSERKGKSWETTPMDIAKEVSKSLSERVVIAKVDGELWDLDRPLEKSVKLELLDFEHPEDEGFFYEMATDRPVVNADYPALEKIADSAVKDKQKFERLVVSKEKLLEMFHVRGLPHLPIHG
ncbi:hypothetical protein NMY22_g19218 [Coprinellus aureogranulatus]|nr:hypothetical protein NMY22_g19218 [Coprinellus aureogranulatus]